MRIAIKALQTHILIDIAHKNSGPNFPFPDPHLPLALDPKIWYNEPMDQEIITTPDVVPSIKRAIASSLQRVADSEINYYPKADAKLTHRDILATILWDIATSGVGFLSDGEEIKPESYMEWLATVKYLITHLDGPVGGEEGMGTNVFKVYVGVQIDKI